MKKISLLILSLLFTLTACQKSVERKMTPVSLDEFVKAYPGMEAIAEEKSALDIQADELKPTRDENLIELTKVLAKLYTVYTENLPQLIEREKELQKIAIHEWKERSIQKVENAEEQARTALDQIEVNALRDQLAVKVKANQVAKERFTTFGLMAAQLQSQGEELMKQAQEITPEKTEALLKDQETFNTLATFIQEEQQWLLSHPPTNETREVIEQWKMDHPHTPSLEKALSSYQQEYP